MFSYSYLRFKFIGGDRWKKQLRPSSGVWYCYPSGGGIFTFALNDLLTIPLNLKRIQKALVLLTFASWKEALPYFTALQNLVLERSLLILQGWYPDDTQPFYGIVAGFPFVDLWHFSTYFLILHLVLLLFLLVFFSCYVVTHSNTDICTVCFVLGFDFWFL